ncbi:MAG: chorismate pyruvate-lyase family protein [Nitrospirota bacterium]|nr:chorismate pyruvate-lyase family protein [Nitrospirota bacterium]
MTPVVPLPGTHRERLMARLEAIFGALSPLLRVLLTTDGTVTETLAAHFGEEVGVKVVTQGFHPADGEDFPELALRPGSVVLDRCVVLTGARSGRAFAVAVSRIVPALLPGAMQEDLLAAREPLGKLLLAHRLETFKEIVDCGVCPLRHAPLPPGNFAAALKLAPGAPLVWRTYRVLIGGRAAMSVSEYFPESLA